MNNIIQVSLLGLEDVYDIAIHEYKNFIVEQYIVHNSIEQDSDLVLMLYKDREMPDSKKVDIIIAKHRNGPIGSFQLIFHAETGRFTSVEPASMTEISY